MNSPISRNPCSYNTYIQKERRRSRNIRFTRFLLFTGFLFLWQIAADLQIIDSFFFSSPKGIATTFWHLLMYENLLRHLAVTLLETFVGFLIVTFVSILFAGILWFSPFLRKVTEPLLVLLNSLPKSALAPLFLVWLGSGAKTIITAGISVCIFGSVINILTGFCMASPDAIFLIQTLGGTGKDAFFKVVFPSSVPVLFGNAKINIGLTLVGIIIGEFLAAKKGLGYLIIYGSQVFRMDMVLTSIVILCLVSYALYHLISVTESLTAKYFNSSHLPTNS